MKASAPPAAHTDRKSQALGTSSATAGDVNRMPPPITFETMTAAASSGPRRRSSAVGAVPDADAEAGRDKCLGTVLSGQQLALEAHAVQLDPLIGGLTDEDQGFDIPEGRVFEHVRA